MKRLFAGVLCLCMLLCGCSQSTDNPYTPTGNALEYGPGQTGPAPQTPQEEAAAGFSLPYYKDKSLNPYTCNDFTNRVLFSLLYQGLFSIDRNYTVQPQLCKTYTVSEDMKTYTFTLEKATFSNGKTVTAADVAASLNAAKAGDYYKGRFFHIAEILAEGENVVIKLNVPYEDLLMLLDIPIVPESQVTAEKPIGSGPYTFHTAAVGDSLQKHSNWWCDATLPISAQTISLYAAVDATDIRDQFEFSDLTVSCADPGSDRYVDYRCDYELWDAENGIFLYLAVAAGSELFFNTALRSALTHAIDRAAIVKEFYRGFASPATLPASPKSPYYSQILAQRYEYDQAKFSQVVTTTGFAEKEIILLVNRDDSLRLRVARSIEKMLEAGGLVVTVKDLSGDTYLTTLKNREYDLYLGQTRLSPNMDLSAFFHTYGELSWGGLNDVGTYNLCLQALENYGNYFTLHKQVMDDGLICPILFRNYAIFADRGVVPNLTPSRDNLFYYSTGKTLADAKLETQK